jgi:hypothetical protein
MLLACTVTSGGCFAVPERKIQNLKVLPENISSKDLSRVMIDDFEDGLEFPVLLSCSGK